MFQRLGTKNCLNKNWMSVYDPSIIDSTGAVVDARMLRASPMGKYLASFYYAVVTFSTIGYGDVTPTNDLERACSTCLALTGATVFAYTALIAP